MGPQFIFFWANFYILIFLIKRFIILFIYYFWLCWVFVAVGASHYGVLVQSTGSRALGLQQVQFPGSAAQAK